jgi:hypothetical protein
VAVWSDIRSLAVLLETTPSGVIRTILMRGVRAKLRRRLTGDFELPPRLQGWHPVVSTPAKEG